MVVSRVCGLSCFFLFTFVVSWLDSWMLHSGCCWAPVCQLILLVGQVGWLLRGIHRLARFSLSLALSLHSNFLPGLLFLFCLLFLLFLTNVLGAAGCLCVGWLGAAGHPPASSFCFSSSPSPFLVAVNTNVGALRSGIWRQHSGCELFLLGS